MKKITIIIAFAFMATLTYKFTKKPYDYGTAYEEETLERFNYIALEKRTWDNGFGCPVNTYFFEENDCGLRIMFNCDQPSLRWGGSCETISRPASIRTTKLAREAEKIISGNTSHFVDRITTGQIINNEDTASGFKANSYIILKGNILLFTVEPLTRSDAQ